MEEVDINFEREGLEGVIPVGTYLIDAAKRFGIRFADTCIPTENIHFCEVAVTTGSEILSPPTALETVFFDGGGSIENRRLACQSKLERSGEIVVMTKEKEKEIADEATFEVKSEEFKKEFAEMPLEKKIASLVQLEAIALGETFSFVVNSPFKVFDKIMDVMAEFGLKKDEEARAAARPDEHKAGEAPPKPEDTTADETVPGANGKTIEQNPG